MATAALLMLSSGASAQMTSHSRVHHARPRAAAAARAGASASASYPVTSFTQDFGDNTKYFCPAGSGNHPCDGNGPAGDYGTIDRVLSHFSNGGVGNYAPFTKALTEDWMALVSGTGDGNQGAGCPGTTPTSNPGENCTGPFALFGTGKAEGAENVFPTSGFTVTDDLYLSPTTGGPAGSLVDDDVELNLPNSGFGIDNVITACAEPVTVSGPLGYVINFGHNSPGSCSGSPVITTDGWYRFVFVFSDQGGNAYLDEYVRSEPGAALVATSGPQPVGGGSPEPISQWGGPGYFWLPSLDMSGLPLANFALQLGTFANGHKP
ncbi:MAG TPA: hypothetical protein VIX86_17270 [Streptosporangiaceae bacterium]